MAQLTRQEVMEAGQVEVTVEDYGFTGEGWVRLEDGWLSIRGALPGERVRVEVEAGQRPGARRLFARVLEVLEASSVRRDPLCDQAAVCRGCQLRHMTVDEELKFKVRAVAEVVAKYAGLPEDEQPAIQILTPQPISRGDSFRIRTSLSYVSGPGGGYELGLVSPGREGLVAMHLCPALTAPVHRLMATVRAAIEACGEPVPDARAVARGEAVVGLERVRIAAPGHGQGLVELELRVQEGGPGDAAGGEVRDRALGELVRLHPFVALVDGLREGLAEGVGLAITASGQPRIHVKEPRRTTIPMGGHNFEVGYDDWFHATLEPAEVLYEALGALLEPVASDRLLDVGCGTGTIGVLCSPRVEAVVGVDLNRHSIEAAELNALGNERANVRFVAGSWESALRRLTMAGERFTVATINPMREPLGRRTLSYLPALGVERLVYLGPSPVAAARDLGELRELGYRIDYLAAANLHPATYHTMLVARLRRQG